MEIILKLQREKYRYFFHFMQYIIKHRDSLFKDFMKLNELFRLISGENIMTFFQPIISMNNGQTIGYEIFNRPPATSIFPTTEDFYDFIGQTQHIFTAERFSRKLSIQRFSQEVAKKPEMNEKLVFLNIHPKVINDPEFRSGETLKMLEWYGLSPKQIILELTERESVKDYQKFEKVLYHYRSQGFRIAVDDAGTGYNSLKTIVYLKPEFIKLDKSLIRDIHQNTAQQHMVQLLLDYANKTGTQVIAEGIEQHEEFEYIHRAGVHYGQGYAIGKPHQELFEGHLAR